MKWKKGEKRLQTLSGWSLTGEQEEEKIVEVDPSLEKAHEDYKSIFGKKCPSKQKEWHWTNTRKDQWNFNS